MEIIVSKKDDFVVDALFYFETVQRFEYREQGSFQVAGDELFVFAVSLNRVEL